MNYFEEDILDQRITKQDVDDVNRFINLGIKEHGDNYNGDGTSLLSWSEYKLLLCSTGWLCSNIIDSALVLLHKSYPSNKSNCTWSYFETHLGKFLCENRLDIFYFFILLHEYIVTEVPCS
ncbi:hypothetical protein MKW92_017390 [Papaver armeniacum]|nr:hypothetical protein MKW92_017390 [Papaver armeniacum]